MTQTGTHWDGCWQAHLPCAQAKIDVLSGRNDSLQEEIGAIRALLVEVERLFSISHFDQPEDVAVVGRVSEALDELAKT